jgi:hypothetical protein
VIEALEAAKPDIVRILGSDLAEAVTAYIGSKVEASALPDRLLAILGQPPAADGIAALTRFREIADALSRCGGFVGVDGIVTSFAGGIEIRLEHGHVVLRHHWKGCPLPEYTLSGGTTKETGMDKPTGATPQQ